MTIHIDPDLRSKLFIRRGTHFLQELEAFLNRYTATGDRLALHTQFAEELWPHVTTTLTDLGTLDALDEEVMTLRLAFSAIQPGTMANLIDTRQHLGLISGGIQLIEDHVLPLLDQYAQDSSADEASDILLALGEALRIRAAIAQRAGEMEAALAGFQRLIDLLDTLPRQKATLLKITAYSGLADTYRIQGDLSNAQQAIRAAVDLIDDEVRDTQEALSALANMSIILDATGHVEEAYTILRQIDIDKVPPADRKSLRMNRLLMRYAVERSPDTLDELTQFAEDSKRSGDLTLAASIWNNLGEIARQEGRIVAALDYFQEVVTIQRDMRNDNMLADTLSNISLCYMMLGQHKEAEAKISEAVAIFERTNNLKGLSIITNSRASMLAQMGQFEDALAWMERSMTYRRATKSPERIGQGLAQLGSIHHQIAQREQYENGRIDQVALHKAIDYLEQAQTTVAGVDLPHIEVSIMNSLGECYRLQGQLDQAEALFDQALPLARSINHQQMLGTLYNNLGTLAYERRQVERAYQYLLDAARVQETIPDYNALMYTYSNMLQVCADHNLMERALEPARGMMAILNKGAVPHVVRHGVELLLALAMNNPPHSQLWAELIPIFETALAYFQTQIDLEAVQGIASFLIHIHAARGEQREIASLCTQLLPYARQHNDLNLQAGLLANLSPAYLQLNQHQQLCETLGQLIALIETHQLDTSQWGGAPLHFYKAKYRELGCG